MKGRRRLLWLWVPVLGGAAMLVVPPMDEYAAFDAVGTRFDPPTFDVTPIPPDAPAAMRADLERMNRETLEDARKRDEQYGVARRRAWRVRAPEGEARQVIARTFSLRSGWRKVGTGAGSSSNGNVRSRSESNLEANDETGDQAEVETTTQIAPVPGARSIQIFVTEMKSPRDPLMRFKRWLWRLAGR